LRYSFTVIEIMGINSRPLRGLGLISAIGYGNWYYRNLCRH